MVGGGPIGAATAHALAAQHQCAVHWFEANDPLRGDFSRLSMSCPWAAGQVLVQSFEPDSPGKRYGMRTLEVLRGLGARGLVPIQPRPWLVCARKGAAPVDVAAAEVLDAAWRAGRLEQCERLPGASLARFPGLRHEEMEFAICDEQALGVDPRALAMGLAQWAADTPGVVPHFGARVLSIGAGEVVAAVAGEALRVPVHALALCVGVHGSLEAGGAAMLDIEGHPLSSWIPPARVTHLHVFDHRVPGHMPTVTCSVAGAATIARYEVFGAGRSAILPHLPQPVRDFDINPLLTDVPGLCRLLDTHFPTRSAAEAHTVASRDAIADCLKQLLHAEHLTGDPTSRRVVTESAIASYVKHDQPTDAPLLHQLATEMPICYVQPTNGRGVTQCIGLGEEAARRVAAAR